MNTLPAQRVLLFIYVLLLLVPVGIQAQPAGPALDRFAPDTVLVKFRPGTPAAEKAQVHAAANAQVIRTLTQSDVVLVRVPSGAVDRSLNAYRNNPNILTADKNYRRVIYLPATMEGSETIGIAPNNVTFQNFNEQWNLHNTGQEFGLTLNYNSTAYLYPSYEGVPDADINAPEAWEITSGDSSMAIGILDTGVDCAHTDLIGKCVDMANFVGEHGSSLTDELGHGTHVAGIAAASTDNEIGIAGVGWNSSIAALKVCWEDSVSAPGLILGVCDDADVIEAIDHAVIEGHRILSMSFAGSGYSETMESELDAAWNNGVLLIAAAGNTYTDDLMYPASYANVLSVGASDHLDNLSAFSNYGVAASVLAPGSHIMSTVPGKFCGQGSGVPSECYDTKSGTSMAAPHVAGLAALMMYHYPSASNADIRTAIESSADTIGALGQNLLAWSAHGRINMQAALASDPTSPGGTDPTTVLVQQPPTLSTVNLGKGEKRGHAEVTIVNDLGDVVPNADVTGEFSGSFTEQPIVAITDNSGVAVFDTTGIVKGGVSFTFCVETVSAALDFQSSVNDCSSF